MDRYTVWHKTVKFDGDASFEKIEDARQEFDDQCQRRNVVAVEITDNLDGTVIERYDATSDQ